MQWENLKPKPEVPISSENQYSVTTSPTWRGTDELHKGQVKCEVIYVSILVTKGTHFEYNVGENITHLRLCKEYRIKLMQS